MKKRAENLLEAKQQAAVHKATRAAHGSEVAEDYVEVIDDLIRIEGKARAIDIARRLGVSHVAVNKTVNRLQEEGLVETQPYKSIALTRKGATLAKKCRERHETVFQFLRELGVSENVAHIDAEGIEHHVSEETLAAFRKYLR